MNKLIVFFLVLLSMFYINNIVNNNKDMVNNDDNISNKNYVILNDYNMLGNNEIVTNDYIIGVLACEMPALYPDEALKAQTIAIRTYAYYNYLIEKKDYNNNEQCYITKEEMKNKWKNNYDVYYEKLKNIVFSTNNLVIEKNNKLLKTFYFSTSSGTTENSMDVFEEQEIKSVDSSFDMNSKDYVKTVEYKKEYLIDLLGDFDNIEIVNINNTGHINFINVDNNQYTGVEFRKLLNLRSTKFEININNDSYYFTTYGYGHDVGMSQYGASYLASNYNKNYEDILKYYYGDIKIKEI